MGWHPVSGRRQRETDRHQRGRDRALGSQAQGLRRTCLRTPGRALPGAAARACASVLFPEDPADLDNVRRNAERFVATGFTAIKFGWGGFGQDRRQDVALVRTAREALPPHD
ncbi:MAG: hypothetical protein M3Z20_19730 [Chloroflexota bacterium]|nr:hypothetical protein [Chloroflexota bacterium]